MKTRDLIIIAVVAIALIVAYLMFRSSSSSSSSSSSTTTAPTTAAPTTAAPKDPRANLSMLLSSPATQGNAGNDWSILSNLVKSITGKPAPICVDIPETSTGPSPAKSINSLYAIKAALNVAAANNNFYDIAALFLQMIKTMGRPSPFTLSPTYDSNGLLATIYVNESSKGHWTVGLFKNSMRPSIDMPAADKLANDPDMISFMKNMVPFYNSFVGSFSTMTDVKLSNKMLDAETFAKLISCMLALDFSQKGSPPFDCTSSKK